MHLCEFASSEGVILLAVVSWVAFFGVLGAMLWSKVRARRSRTPQEVLFRRFAAGEIDDDEFRRHMEALRAEPQVSGRVDSRPDPLVGEFGEPALDDVQSADQSREASAPQLASRRSPSSDAEPGSAW
ncbi:hypothetical protein Pth03_03620 [Planotetraspora thailandica]|uniref:SHOCT domain-containing protein n=1 Tax=Planotetraspora thailandica TaxID=487172 RepID=A0A8J3UTY5_9ACTN|nr:hypothetical protein [Planotetraspora thailandica]GII51973.1 hypothetical protein Pth03_03620 [Planotetraspora thailandica]